MAPAVECQQPHEQTASSDRNRAGDSNLRRGPIPDGRRPKSERAPHAHGIIILSLA